MTGFLRQHGRKQRFSGANHSELQDAILPGAAPGKGKESFLDVVALAGLVEIC